MKKIFLLLILPTVLFARGTETINGYLHDKTTGEPLPFANVMLKNTQLGDASDVYGYYVINGIPPGNYTLIVSMMGYEHVEKEIEIQPKGKTRFDFEIAPAAIEGEEVVVTAEKTRFEEEVEISRTNISIKEIRSTPSFIEADVFRTIQQLPSVTSQNDFSSALVVRGGSPDENLILLDGAEIYNPYHLGGLFSTFNADAISDAEFLAGSYPAQYSGRLSSILNITSYYITYEEMEQIHGNELGAEFIYSHKSSRDNDLTKKYKNVSIGHKVIWGVNYGIILKVTVEAFSPEYGHYIFSSLPLNDPQKSNLRDEAGNPVMGCFGATAAKSIFIVIEE